MAREVLELAVVRDMARTGKARDLRIAAGLSLAEVARDVGVSTTTIHNWERGRFSPRGEPAARYGRLLGELRRLARELSR
jgi:DNA-binding XRE family transcriptional regulator